MHTESMPLSGIFSCVRLWIFLGTKKHRNGDKFMKKQTIKTIVTALTAAAMVCSLTGCAGNSSGVTETLNAEKSSAAENTEAAAGVEQDNEKDSVIVVMGPSSEPEAGFDPAYGLSLIHICGESAPYRVPDLRRPLRKCGPSR